MEKKRTFRANQAKASMQVEINAVMMTSLFVILSLILTLKPDHFSTSILLQLSLSIPLLFVSTLAYAKIGFWGETKLWEGLAWFGHNIGNVFVLNAAGLMVATAYPITALVYFITSIVLMLVYSIINILHTPELLREKTMKFLIFFGVLFFGGLLPLLFS